MPDLEDGCTAEVKGSGSKPWIIKNVGGVYSCNCPAWRNQSLPPHQRTCKHIRLYRGEEAETERLGAAALSSPPPRVGEETEGPGVLLADSWDFETNLQGWWMSEKLDGARAYWDGKQFLSRNGKPFLAPDWFLEGLPPVVLDGELWIDRKAFQRTMSVIRRQDRPDEWRQVKYVVFDAPEQVGPFESRMEYLKDLLETVTLPNVQFLAQQLCQGMDHLLEELQRIESLGGEGLMMRQPGSLYIRGRSASLLKVKTFLDSEATVIGHIPGQGKHKGRLGALEVELPTGARFSIGTGFSDAQRENPPGIGTVVQFRYQELSEYGVPRFPSYVGIRDDGLITPLRSPPAAMRAQNKEATVAKSKPSPASEPVIWAYEYSAEDRHLIWEATLIGTEVTLRFGPVDQPLTKKVKFTSVMEAEMTIFEWVAEKKDDGFRERNAAPVAEKPKKIPVPTPPTPTPAPTAAPAASDTPAGVRHFEYVEGTSSKFWEVWTSGNQMFTKYGRIGSSGTTTVKTFPDEAGAQKAATKLIAEKTGKGYEEK